MNTLRAPAADDSRIITPARVQVGYWLVPTDVTRAVTTQSPTTGTASR